MVQTAAPLVEERLIATAAVLGVASQTPALPVSAPGTATGSGVVWQEAMVVREAGAPVQETFSETEE